MEGHLDDAEPLSARKFVIAARRLADSLDYGTDHSPFKGAGIEYVQSRPYEPGDSIRTIDWRVTARTGRFHVKEYEAPKRLPVYLLVDTSASMTITSYRISKYRLAVQMAAGIALACLDRVSPVGLVGTGERDIFVKPSLSKNQVLEWFLRLRQFRYDETTSLQRRITELVPSLRQRAMIMILSDLHDEGAGGVLRRAAQQHDCVVLQLEDPAERGLGGVGLFRAREAETGIERVTHGRAKWVDPTVNDASLKRAGIDHLRIHTNQPFVHRLRYFLQARNLLGRGAR